MLARSVSLKFGKTTLNSLNVCSFSLWVITTINAFYSPNRPFRYHRKRRQSVTVSPAFLRAAASVSARNICSLSVSRVPTLRATSVQKLNETKRDCLHMYQRSGFLRSFKLSSLILLSIVEKRPLTRWLMTNFTRIGQSILSRFNL